MPKFLLSFFALFSISNFSFAGADCATGTSGAIDGIVICAIDNGKSNVELVASGLILVASLVAGVYLVVSLLNK